MLRTIRQRIQSEEKGFTLIELLVVILIIGILAAIAIPAFLGQREKAQDSSAKSAVRNAQSAAEAFYTDGQTYAGMTTTTLRDIEPSLPPDTKFSVTLTGVAPNQGYELQVTSDTTGTFKIAKTSATEPASRTCGPADRTSKGGCKAGAW